jgi:protease-4
MLSEARGFAPDERVAIQRQMQSIYDTFLTRVVDGRRIAREELEQVARGRIWSGADALRLGLIDRLGGPLEALAEVRLRAGFGRDEWLGLDVLPRIPRLPRLLALASGSARAPRVRARLG